MYTDDEVDGSSRKIIDEVVEEVARAERLPYSSEGSLWTLGSQIEGPFIEVQVIFNCGQRVEVSGHAGDPHRRLGESVAVAELSHEWLWEQFEEILLKAAVSVQ